MLLCLSCPAARGDAGDYICVQPGDSGYDVRIVLKTAAQFGYLKNLPEDERTYQESYVSAVTKLEKALSLTADGIVTMSEMEAIDGVIIQGSQGDDVKAILEKLADLGYFTSLPDSHDKYTERYLEGIKKAEKALSLTVDGYLTRAEQNRILKTAAPSPDQVTGFTVTAKNGKASLTWKAVKNALAYEIKRDDQATWTVVKGTSYTDDTVKMDYYYDYSIRAVRYTTKGTAVTAGVYIDPVYTQVTGTELNKNVSKYMSKFIKITTSRSKNFTITKENGDWYWLFPCGNGNYVYLLCRDYNSWTWRSSKGPQYYKDLQFTVEGQVTGTRQAYKDSKYIQVPVVEVKSLSFTYWD